MINFNFANRQSSAKHFMTIDIDNNIKLELIEEKHTAELFNLVSANRNYLREWLPWVDNMQSVEFIEGFINSSMQRNNAKEEYAFVIMADGKMEGRIGIYKIDNQNKIGEIGYWVSEGRQGKGLVSKCCKALIEYGFEKTGLNRIEIKCGTENYKSQAIPERLNFKFEGILRQAELIRENFIDLKLYSMLKKEWKK